MIQLKLENGGILKTENHLLHNLPFFHSTQLNFKLSLSLQSLIGSNLKFQIRYEDDHDEGGDEEAALANNIKKF